jgi:hypothetical protein
MNRWMKKMNRKKVNEECPLKRERERERERESGILFDLKRK